MRFLPVKRTLECTPRTLVVMVAIAFTLGIPLGAQLVSVAKEARDSAAVPLDVYESCMWENQVLAAKLTKEIYRHRSVRS